MTVIDDLVVIASAFPVWAGSWFQAFDSLGEYKAQQDKLFPEQDLTGRDVRIMAKVVFSWHGRWKKGLELSDEEPSEDTKYLRLAQSWMLIMFGAGIALIVPLLDLFRHWFKLELRYPIVALILYAVIAAGTWIWLVIRLKRISHAGATGLLSIFIHTIPAAVLWPLTYMIIINTYRDSGWTKPVPDRPSHELRTIDDSIERPRVAKSRTERPCSHPQHRLLCRGDGPNAGATP